jgi:hypothetical protein
MTDSEFQRRLELAELEELVDRKIAGARRAVLRLVAIAVIAAVVVAVVVVFTFLHLAAVTHWTS